MSHVGEDVDRADAEHGTNAPSSSYEVSSSDAEDPWPWVREFLGVDSPDQEFNLGDVRRVRGSLILRGSDDERTVLTPTQLASEVSRVRNGLQHLGLQPRDRVATALGSTLESFSSALAVWQAGGILVPLFAGFGAKAIEERLMASQARFVLTGARGAHGPVMDAVRSDVGTQPVVVLRDDQRWETTSSSVIDLRDGDRRSQEPYPTRAADPATIMFTSGTTGAPKGCVIPHWGVGSLLPFLRWSIGVGEGDRMCTTAGPGWSFGLYTTGLGPLLMGADRIILSGAFDPARWWRVAEEENATHLASAPTAYRKTVLSVQDGSIDVTDLPTQHARRLVAAGEPIDAATVNWFERELGEKIQNTYGLTELGMVLAQHGEGDMAARGALGSPVPGFRCRIDATEVDGTGRAVFETDGITLGTDYWDASELWESRVTMDGWRTDDIVRQDESGVFHYVARADDVIVTSGYNVGPSEIETALETHPAVAEAGCIGVPDPVRSQRVVAFVVLDTSAGAAHGSDDPLLDDEGEGKQEPDIAIGRELVDELRAVVTREVGRHAAPRAFVSTQRLPRTSSGKLSRSALRQDWGRRREPDGSGDDDAPRGS